MIFLQGAGKLDFFSWKEYQIDTDVPTIGSEKAKA